MKKILFRKILIDCLTFFFITLFSASIIIWVFQAVNYLDIMIEDGRDYLVYINYSLLNFPKILSRVLPFIFFFSFFYVITKYEVNNELMIFWNFGINKFQFINFFFKFSILLSLIQLLLVSVIVPKSQDTARSFLRTSSVNILDSFIKQKKFNDTIKGVTIYSETKNEDGTLTNIYLKKQNDKNNYQITYAKNGNLIKKNNSQILELRNGETISVNNNKITNFKFSKSDFNFQNMETNTTTYIKTQEVSTTKLIKCLLKLEKLTLFNIDINDVVVENCVRQNQDNVLKELYKRLITPFYLPTFMLILLFLTLRSKENINYFKFKIIIFLLGIAALIASEMTLKFIKINFLENIKLIIIPLIMITILYFIFYINLKSVKLKK
tara:strand:+ start:488 stop:1630 length:1143 start_codon:yes stop_codon:yes gene_type:complete